MNQESPCFSVLLIDDEALALDFIAYGFEHCNDVRLRYDARSENAVALAREVSATTVLVDLRMPGADGFDVIRMLRADPATVRAACRDAKPAAELADLARDPNAE